MWNVSWPIYNPPKNVSIRLNRLTAGANISENRKII